MSQAVRHRGQESIIDRMLEVVREEILPLTEEGVGRGSKIFGAAILARTDLNLILAETNRESENPLYHGEIACLNRFWSIPRKERPAPSDCLFLSTHEPCSLCLSAITWSGFDNFYYLFPYRDSRDEFEIPHDLKILREVFRCEEGNYAATNAYWTSYSLIDLIRQGDEIRREARLRQVEDLREAYVKLSAKYQKRKALQDIPLR